MESYFKARSGSGFLILGNKSSIFLPVANNSLIIVERQEEDEYRNEEGFKFNVNTMALRRAEIENISVIFGSASPSMEMFKCADDGRLTFIEGDWVNNRKYSIVRQSVDKGVLPEELIKIIKESSEKGENVAIYTPRRDYGSSIRCPTCREPHLCQHCEGPLSYQRQSNLLVCTNCSSSFDYREKCTKCGSRLIYTPYIGVELIEEGLKAIFKSSRIVSVTGETLKVALKTLQKITDQDHLILVGSQALSKLYTVRIDMLILVGWENLLKIAGYRADEKMFQIFINLLDALRPRELCFFMDKKMAVNPDRYFDLKRFYTDELKKRRIAEFPPYVRFFLIDVEKKREEASLKIIGKINKALEQDGLINYVTGPLKQKMKAGHRWKFILKGDEKRFYKTLFSMYDLSGVNIEADPPSI